MLKYKNKKTISVQDWDNLVKETYNKPYSFQQQDGCKDRGNFDITIPSEEVQDEYFYDLIPEVVNGDKMGVKFAVWLVRDPKETLKDEEDGDRGWMIEMFWERNFYPDINILANDLHAKGLIEAGDYTIDIDW